MLSRIQFDKVLFLDIETVPQIYQYEDLDEKGQELFYAKNRFQVSPEKNIDTIYNVKLCVFLLEWFVIHQLEKQFA
jgi:hypothetical protein